jgi:hypothetical protein
LDPSVDERFLFREGSRKRMLQKRFGLGRRITSPSWGFPYSVVSSNLAGNRLVAGNTSEKQAGSK